MEKITTISGAAKRLVDNNAELRTTIEAHPTESYKKLQAKVTTRLCGRIGKDIGQFVRPRDLIWAMIDYVNDENDGAELQW